MKNGILVVAALALFLMPVTAVADVITFNITATAPNTNNSTDNVNETDYQGGANQFDLDHHRAYTWRISNVTLPPGHVITGATITFRNIANWDRNANMLFVHLLNTANNSGIRSALDAVGVPVTTISDFFAAANSLGPAPGADNILLFQRGFNMVGQSGAYFAGPGAYIAQNFTHTFTAAQLATLAAYIAQGNNLAFGFDSDCHFWNNGIVFTIHTRGQEPIPEPATLALLGTGLLGTGFYLRRRRQMKSNSEK